MSTKYRYQLTSGGYEGCSWVTLEHDQKFTTSDLGQLMQRAMASSVLILANGGILSLNHVTSLGDLWHEAVEILKRSYGFSEVVLEAEHHVFGWRSLTGTGFGDHEESNDIVKSLANHGFGYEFFQTWEQSESQPPLTNEEIFGASAGIAFRMNELLGRRAVTSIEYPDWEDP